MSKSKKKMASYVAADGACRGKAGKSTSPQRPMHINSQLRDSLNFAYDLRPGLFRQTAAHGSTFTPTLTTDEAKALFGPAVTLGAPQELQIAMDCALERSGIYDLICTPGSGIYSHSESMPSFLGYAFLSGLAQNGLIRAGVETIAGEMTRNWIELTRSGKLDKFTRNNTQKAYVGCELEQLEKNVKNFGLQALFNKAAELSQYFGGCLAFIDTGASDETLKTPLHLDHSTFQKNSLRGFTLIEPINIAPGFYNSDNPLRPDYFEPETWFILGKEVHKSRFLKFIANEPPLLLRPAYNFFGIPLAQTVFDYVSHFTESREAAARLLTKFSLTVFKTNLSGVFGENGSTEDIDLRIQYLVQNRNNDGVLRIDYETEDIVKLETPLGGVTDIVRQSLELVASMFRIPVVKYLGISPSGFNATGEADLRNHYDNIALQQEKLFRIPLQKALEVLQINNSGNIDPHISFEFNPLSEDDKSACATANKIKAETDAIYLENAVLTPAEIRTTLAEDKFSGYNGIEE